MTETTTIEVELLAFGDGAIRPVDVPLREIEGRDVPAILEAVFYHGQNDFQAKPFPSVSVGDVVRLRGKRYRVQGMGFEEVPA